jgi:hypothetical protein
MQMGVVVVSRKFFKRTLKIQQIARCDILEGWCVAMQEKKQECVRSDKSKLEMLGPYK